MELFKRQLNLQELLRKKSFFLLGPRATGKSTLVREQLSDSVIILNLLKSQLRLRLLSSPWDLESIIEAERNKKLCELIVIDEIQKIPELLEEVHNLIENRHWRFLLTGSSARKLKSAHTNLLGGRAWTAHLYPLSYSEIPNFDLERYLRFGGLPMVYQSEDPEEELDAYVSTYLYEEIQGESLVRNLPQFSRFLKTAALSSGQLLNFTQISSDAQVPASTIQEHYRILEDTLIGFRLEPWIQSEKRKAITTSKFYLFDTGVTHALAGTKQLDRNSDLYGRSFEHWIGMELTSYLNYRRKKDKLCFWRTKQGQEVDFIVGNHTGIEVKSSKKLSKSDFSGLLALAEENKISQLLLVSQDEIETQNSQIHAVHWKTFIDKLWAGDWF